MPPPRSAGTHPADEQEDRPDDHMRTVKTCCHKEVGEELVAAELPALVQQVVVFIALQRREQDTQHDRDDQTVFQVRTIVAMDQRMVRPCHGTARQQQDQRIDQRQVEGVNLIDHRRHVGRADIFVHRVERVFEKAPEPRREKHDFGHYEQDEAIAQADLHHFGVVPDLAFFHHFGPPRKHGVERAHKADQKDEGCDIMHPQDTACEHDKSKQRAEQRPDGRG